MASPTVSRDGSVLELDDIQGLVARGYGNLPAAGFVLVGMEEPRAAREWLRGLADSVTPASERASRHSLNVAFAPPGLAKLGVNPVTTSGFSPEFVGGMTTPHRGRLLGDLDRNSPDGWAWGGPSTPQVDALLLLYAVDAAELDAFHAAQARGLATGGLREIATLPTRELDAYEHFGFHDGISQPIVEGLSRTGRWEDTVRAGEFVLGYPNEYGLYTTSPLVGEAEDPRGLLLADLSERGSHDFGRNGTYLVLRQLRQFVHRFWGYADMTAHRHTEAGRSIDREAVAAKMVGRWPSGAPLVLAPDRDDERLSGANEFDYHGPDPFGHRCPIGSHIRRANPRDSLDPDPGSRASVSVGKRHRILRRGRGYGARIDVRAALDGEEDPREDRGLHFLCLNANIARQFEFVQHTWVNNATFGDLYDDPDPLVGAISGPQRDFTIQGRPLRTRLPRMPEFVSVRGGAYFFLPGIRAIRYLASLGS